MKPGTAKLGGFLHRIHDELLRQGWTWCRRCEVWQKPPETDPDHCRHCQRKQTLPL